MKRNYKWVCAVIFVLLGISTIESSCSSNDEILDEEIVDVNSISHRISPEQASLNALDFVKQFNDAAGTRGAQPQISEIIAIGRKTVVSRSENGEGSVDSLFYIVNFDNNNGFVIAASDDREVPILAYIDEGNYDENDTTNVAFNEVMDDIRYMEENLKADDPTVMPEEDPNQSTRVYKVMKPLLVTKWGQYTYASYCPNFTTGCVMTAVSQICSFLSSPKSIQWSDENYNKCSEIDWDRILEECSENDGNVKSSDLVDQISQLMRYWGLSFNAEYEVINETSANSSYAIKILKELGYNATSLTGFNAGKVMNDLNDGNKIVYMRSRDEEQNIGHAWVVDGYIYDSRGEKPIYLHCNWGWGGSYNGYFLSSVLDTKKKKYNDDATPVTRDNYTYGTKTSTICK